MFGLGLESNAFIYVSLIIHKLLINAFKRESESVKFRNYFWA